MEITIELLLKGKSTIIKDKEFLSTSDYVKPFLDEMKTRYEFRQLCPKNVEWAIMMKFII